MLATGAHDHHHRVGCGPPHPAGQGKVIMPMPRWLAQVIERVFNRIEIKRGVRPVLIHVGRVSGTTYLTPLDAHPVADGYLFIPMYGPRTDWVKNVMATGYPSPSPWRTCTTRRSPKASACSPVRSHAGCWSPSSATPADPRSPWPLRT